MDKFTAHIPDSQLQNLRHRIRDVRWPEDGKAAGARHGLPLSLMKKITSYWYDYYDWKKAEDRINAYPNFLVDLSGYRIHFLQVKGQGSNPQPLILTHGWPGSFLELMSCIPFLTIGESLCFDVVIPSLPGYGFSEKPGNAGINTAKIADLWHALMRELGYTRYFAQGGDFGADVSTHLALQYPSAVKGLHLNYIPFSYTPFLEAGASLTNEEKAAQKRNADFFREAGSYAQQHLKRPLSISYGLNDSPVGLAAWILDIFQSFSDTSKSLEQLFRLDELLDNITLYWLTETIYSSIRLYEETVKNPLAFGRDDFVRVPVGVAHYPFPESFPARKWVEPGFNLQYWNDMPVGGHFAALEQPALFAADVKEFARQVNRLT